MSQPFQLKDGRTALLRNGIEQDAQAILKYTRQIAHETDHLMRTPKEWESLTLDDERAFIRRYTGDSKSLIIIAELDALVIACGGLTLEPFERFNHRAELGMSVLKDYWRLGIGRQLLNAFEAHAQSIDLHKVFLRVFSYNTPAIALYRSAGYVEEGRLRDDVQRYDGSYADTLFMAKFIKETPR